MISRRKPSVSRTETVDPLTRVSDHFILADFLGNQSVYSRGLVNSLVRDSAYLTKMGNVQALAAHGLEPILAKWGPLTVSYGYIAPEVSSEIVKYQDPGKPSHHRFDLGAAVDICVHDFVQGAFKEADDLYMPESARGSPIALAYALDRIDIPYSRIITYSESPYVCLAVSSEEVAAQKPRRAFYENRFTGRSKDKPDYLQMSTPQARSRGLQALQEQGLAHPWQGGGYPSYHGGGRNQYQHRRVSRYTMVSDWLIDLQSIANGAKNVPSLNLDTVQDSFAAAGIAYDWLIKTFRVPRFSIIAGYVSHLNPYFAETHDWREGIISFTVMPPVGQSALAMHYTINTEAPEGLWSDPLENGAIEITLEVDRAITDPSWE